MPAIRSWAWTYNTSTSATTITGKLPMYQPGDLLIAICSADTGSQSWSSPGWTQIVTKTNTSNLAFLYKIAGSSETDPTFTYTVAETANVRIVSIYDYNQSNPFPALYWGLHEENYTSDYSLNGTINGVGQSFMATGDIISGCKFYLRKVGNPTGDIVCKLTSHSGTFGSSSIATTTVYATSNAVSASSLSTNYTLVDFTFSTPYTTTSGTAYVITLEYNGTSSDYIQVGYCANLSPARHEGNACTRTGTTWTAAASNDLIFYIKNNKGVGSTQNALARSVSHGLIGTVDNTLVLIAAAHSATDGLTTFLQGPAVMEEASSGTAHSDSLFWTILPKSNQSLTQQIWFENLSAAAQQILSLAIAPPSKGNICITKNVK